MNPQRIAHQIEKLKKRLAELGPCIPAVSASSTTWWARRAANAKIPRSRAGTAVLSAELYLAGQEQHAIRAAGGPARDASEGGQLQAAAELVTSGWSWRSNWRRPSGRRRAGPWRLIAISCRKILLALRQMVAGLLEELGHQERRLQQLQHMVEQLLRWRYGPKRERVNEISCSCMPWDHRHGQEIPPSSRGE